MEKEIRKAIGKNIAKFRKQKGLSQKELAEKLGIGCPNVSYIETGKYAPRLNTLIKMAQIFDAEMYEFFIFESHISKENVKETLLKMINKDEMLMRLMYRIYLAIRTDYAPKNKKDDVHINP
ncbi:MAG: helix-turn-helix domain-containing protein [Candidatus Gastranaerophilales bacterium]|nr:helix-turn-helix domain-containing protein [Candidatus Gastranaerophilales bacterium]